MDFARKKRGICVGFAWNLILFSFMREREGYKHHADCTVRLCQYNFAVSKQNTNIKMRCLQHKMIISNTSHSVFAALECCCIQRTLKHEYGGPLGHHLVLFL